MVDSKWWHPTGSQPIRHSDIEEGMLIAVERRVFRVLRVVTKDNEVFMRVRRLHGQPAPHERPDQTVTVAGRLRSLVPVYPDGRVPLCTCCGEPWPCAAADREREGARAIGDALRKTERAQVGACMACGEPVTARQKRVVAPEPNVELPGFDAPVFHLRRDCAAGLYAYERSRRKALGGDYTPMLSDTPALFGDVEAGEVS